MKYWLYLEPYVYISIVKNEILLINGLNKESFKSNNLSIIDIVKEIVSDRNHVVEVDVDIVSQIHFNYFFNWLKSTFSGDYVLNEKRGIKPIQFMPLLDSSISIDETKRSFKFNLLIYLNDKCDYNCKHCDGYSKQLIFCKKSIYNRSLEIDKIIDFIESIDACEINSISFIGGDILKYKDLDRLLKYVNSFSFKKLFYVNIKHVKCNADLIKFKIQKHEVHFMISSFDQKLNIDKLIVELNNNNINYIIDIVIEKLEETQIVISDKIKYHPYFNYDNLQFFKENVFLSETDILELPLKNNNIFYNRNLNRCFFGKFIIDVTGNIYVSLASDVIGHISDNSISSLIKKAYYENSLWLLTRNKVNICSECVYNELCPPVSNYEIKMQRYNLCSVIDL